MRKFDVYLSIYICIIGFGQFIFTPNSKMSVIKKKENIKLERGREFSISVGDHSLDLCYVKKVYHLTEFDHVHTPCMYLKNSKHYWSVR